jgi:hypothetical protein
VFEVVDVLLSSKLARSSTATRKKDSTTF